MMKKLNSLLLILCLMQLAYSQEKLLDTLPTKDGKVHYEGVVVVDSVKQSELQRRAKRWFVEAYKSSKDVISLDEPGEIMGKALTQTSYQATFMEIMRVDLGYTINLQFKDGKYRYEIANLRTKYEVEITRTMPKKQIDVPIEDWAENKRIANTKKYFLVVDDQIKSLIQSLETGLKINSTTKKDW
jgi:hypothetical protein